MDIQTKFNTCFAYFEEIIQEPKTELLYNSDFELLVAVILSAQCTDKRVNQITPNLFKHLPDIDAFALSSVEYIFSLIKSCSYPNNKAKHLYELSHMLIQKFNYQIPDNFEDLASLPGVGRKTANVILTVLFNKPAMPVDTHVFRVSNRIGLTINAKKPLDVEQTLLKYTPEYLLHNMHHWLILFGRYTCTAKKPKCTICKLQDICNYFNENNT